MATRIYVEFETERDAERFLRFHGEDIDINGPLGVTDSGYLEND